MQKILQIQRHLCFERCYPQFKEKLENSVFLEKWMILKKFNELYLKNLLPPLAKETGKVNTVLKEPHILGYRPLTLKLFIAFKIFADVGFLRSFTKL